MAAAFLGVAACAVCAPLNPSYRSGELEFYLADLAARAVIVPANEDSPAREVAAKLGLAVIDLALGENEAAGLFQIDSAPADLATDIDRPGGEDVALLLHTSGTTSRPKLVPLSHRNLCASARNIIEALDLSSADRCLNVMPLFHIHGLMGVLCSSMAAGGSVVCTSGYDERDFAGWMTEYTPSWYSAVPTIHRSVLALARQKPALAEASSLRLIRSSSLSLPPTTMHELETTFRVPVIESYGMTEAAHQITSHPLPLTARRAPVPLADDERGCSSRPSSRTSAERKPGSVGFSAGPEVAIMDDAGNPLPAEQAGEIVIRGPNVTAGYVHNPQANAAAFTDGWLRTGDLGHFDEDGYLFISGRKKEIINRGGENVSPREIDEVLLQHTAIEQAIAFAVPHTTLGEDVAAAVVLSAESTADEHELRRFLFNRLAPVKVPTRILIVESIPEGPTGKPQRIGLHEKLEEAFRSEGVEPSNDLERNIVAAFEEILETSRVGATDNFFTLGGDSLKATRAIAQLCAEFHVDIPAVSLFLNPTAAELSLEITRLLAQDPDVLEELLDEIESMSDEEARRRLM